MNKVLAMIVLLNISLLPMAGQNTNSSPTSTPRPRTTNLNRSPTQQPPPKPVTKPAPDTAPAQQTPPTQKTDASQVPGSDAVVAAFNRLIDGIQTTDVEKVMSVYWKSPSLILFNNNGTVTKGWDQVRQNRLSSYPEIKEVKLVVRDVSVAMLGRDGAVVNCLWTQSQTYKGTPETASGRMTLVFKRFGANWKAIHLHTSPESPNPANIPPSEQTPSPKSSPTPSPSP